MVTLNQLDCWGIELEPSKEARSYVIRTYQSEFFSPLVFLFTWYKFFIACYSYPFIIFLGMATKNKNKEKEIVGGEDVSCLEEATPVETHLARVSLKPLIPSCYEKRKVASKAVDKSNLPSRCNPKKQKIDLSNTNRASLVELDPSNLETPTVDAPPVNQDIGLSTSPTTKPTINESMTFLRSETLAWHRFKKIVKTEDLSICYDMSMREFERSTIHDLFKVHKYTFLFLLNMYMSIQALNVYVLDYV